jgi:RecA-family ATPase
MVVIDVFAKVRGNPPTGVAAYDADYAAVSRIKRVADTYGVAVLLVHHVRKQASEDFLSTVSGTHGSPALPTPCWCSNGRGRRRTGCCT